MGKDDKANLEANELDQLTNQMENTGFDDKENDDKEEEPKESKTSPEGRNKPPQISADGRRIMLVAARSRVKQVAGSIARTIREGDSAPPLLSAVGAASVNQAVKAIAIARDFVEPDKTDIVVEVERKPQDKVKDVLVLTLNKIPAGEIDINDETDVVDMRAASQSQVAALAGAISKNVREKKRPRITAIGPKPVFKAVCAIALARKYLQKENMDIDMVPRFTHVKFDNDSEANALQFVILPRTLDATAETSAAAEASGAE